MADRVRPLWRIGALLLVVGSAACSLLVSLDGLTSTTANDAAPAEGATTLPDGQVRLPDGGIAASFSCADHRDAMVCDDFDHGWNLAWGTSASTLAGTIGLAQTTFTSPPNAAAASVFPGDSGGFGSYAYLVAYTKETVSTRYSYDIYIDMAGGTLPSTPALIGELSEYAAFYTYYNIYYIGLDLGASGMSIDQQGQQIDGGTISRKNAIDPPLPLQQWSRIIIEATWPSPLGAGQFSAYVETPPGQARRTIITNQVIPQLEISVGVAVQAGIVQVVPSNASWKIVVDNVLAEEL